MRSSEQVRRTPREWKDAQAAERERSLRAFVAMCRAARANAEPWIAWIDGGCQPLSRDQYQAQGSPRARGHRAAPVGGRA